MTGISTNAIHASDKVNPVRDVIPPINVSTTYKYADNPDDLVKWSDMPEESSIIGNIFYSRITHPNSERVEKALESIVGGPSVAYSSGLGAFFAALTYFNPSIVCIGKGYHGCHSIIDIFTRLKGLKVIGLDDDLDQLNAGDLICLETPVNPDGTVFDIEYFAQKAHEKGAFLLIDSTFAPPPLQEPFKWGADMVLHSATKYLGGHSDLLAGVLVTNDDKVKNQLVTDRLALGTNIANLESYLLLRSLRTFELRITRQAENTEKLVKHLVKNRDSYSKLKKIYHSSLQTEAFVKKQLPNGYSPVFCIELDNESTAKEFPSKLRYFHHATSLGGVESLIEWRVLSDSTVSPTLLRVSVGAENADDLIADFDEALRS